MIRLFSRPLLGLMLACCWAIPLNAQEPDTQLLLTTDTTDLQTGTFYEVRIEVRNVEALWAANTLITYDPALLYVVGTDSGSPVEVGAFLPGRTLFNFVSPDAGLRYTPSLVNPDDPVSGSGVIGTFQIFPLQAGTAQLLFQEAALSRLNFEMDEAGQRLATGSEAIPVLPILLELTITGDAATPPPEATATPTPTATSTPAPDDNSEPTPTPTLFNATPLPPTPAPDPPPTAPDPGIPPILWVAIGLIGIGGLGLIGVFIMARRRR